MAVFHADFWVAVAAAAPVIGLAAVVSLGETLGQVTSVLSLRGARWEPARLRVAWRTINVYQLSAFLGVTNLAIQAVTFYFALLSLNADSDQCPRAVVIATELLGFILLASVIFVNSFAHVLVAAEVADRPDENTQASSETPGEP